MRVGISAMDPRGEGHRRLYIGRSMVAAEQANGVRQGSPDSAVLYSATVGETLQNLVTNDL